jgi:hypothetical protein
MAVTSTVSLPQHSMMIELSSNVQQPTVNHGVVGIPTSATLAAGAYQTDESVAESKAHAIADGDTRPLWRQVLGVSAAPMETPMLIYNRLHVLALAAFVEETDLSPGEDNLVSNPPGDKSSWIRFE